MSYYENDLVDRAVRAHVRYINRIGALPEQPARDACVQRGRTILIANSHRVLGRYRVTGRRGAERLVRFASK